MENGPVIEAGRADSRAPAGDGSRSIRRRSSIADTDQDTQTMAACRQMEALFLQYLLKEMRATVDKSGLMNGGRAEEIYTSMLDGQLAGELSRSGGIGLAQIVYRQLQNADPNRRPTNDGRPQQGHEPKVATLGNANDD